MMGNYHVRCGAGEKSEVLAPETYLSLFGKIPDFDKKLATFRSLRISADIIVQSVAQLKEMYEDRHGKITSNCSITILLGANDIDDCKWFSELIGQTTVKTESVSLDNGGLFPGAKGGSISDNAQSLMRPENIRAMAKDDCLIIVNTQMPIKDKKYNAVKHPRWKESLDSHDAKTACNEFQYRRLFFIEQKDDARAIAVLPPNPAAAVDQKSQKQQPHFKQPHKNRVSVEKEKTIDAEMMDIIKSTYDGASSDIVANYADKAVNGKVDVKELPAEARQRMQQGINSGKHKVDEEGTIQFGTDNTIPDAINQLF